MRLRNASSFASGARETATKVTSRCARCSSDAVEVVRAKEQLLQPASQPGTEHEVVDDELAAPAEEVAPASPCRRAPSKT